MRRTLLILALLPWFVGCLNSQAPLAPPPPEEPLASRGDATPAATGEMPWPQGMGRDPDALTEQPKDAAPLERSTTQSEERGIAGSAPTPLQRAGGQRVIALDPGHGGEEIGAAHSSPQGWVVREKEVNLAVAQKLKQLLEQEGFQVVLTRDSDRRVYALPEGALPPDLAGRSPAFSRTRADLQARIDLANAAGADLFISLHANGSASSGTSGVEVWYDGKRPFATQNLALAQAVQAALLEELRAIGYQAVDRGVKEDSHWRSFQGRSFPLFVLGPPRTELSPLQPTPTRATQMPGILGETLFLSNPGEAALLRQEHVQQALARGYLKGILLYFQEQE